MANFVDCIYVVHQSSGVHQGGFPWVSGNPFCEIGQCLKAKDQDTLIEQSLTPVAQSPTLIEQLYMVHISLK